MLACVARALVLTVLALVVASPLSALTVSGPIGANSTWTANDSPINVTATVTVQNGALLTIEAGVAVRFAAGAQLIVQSGAIRAVGTASAPIMFESMLGTPAPGDWGPIIIGNGAIDATTLLDSAVISHGMGITIQQASPTLNRLTLTDNEGPAVQLDLDSSPVGVELAAVGNGLNGVLIPPGTITGSVRWGLVGIPYVVQQGIVAVGLPPLALSPTTLALRVGQQGVITVLLARPATAGGLTLDLSSSVPSVVAVPSTMTIPEGATEATLTVDGAVPGQANVTVSDPELGAAVATITVTPPASILLLPASSILSVGQTVNLTVELSEPAPAPGVSVSLQSSDVAVATLPAFVNVPTGATSRTFAVTGAEIGGTSLTAGAPGYLSASSTVEVRQAFLSFGPIGVLAPGTTRQVAVNSSIPAPPGGLSIALANTNPGIASTPSSVFLTEGTTSRTVSIQGISVGSTSLTATATNFDSAQSVVNVAQIALSFDPDLPTTIPLATGNSYQIRSNRPAPTGGLSVIVTSANIAIATPQSGTVTIPEGETLASAPVIVWAAANSGSTVITADAMGVSPANLSVTVTGQPSLKFSRSGEVLGKGLTRSVSIQRLTGTSQYADPDSLTVVLASSDPAKVGVPSTVVIPGGASSVQFYLTGVELTSTPVTITATAQGYLPAPSLVATVVTPVITLDFLDNERVVGSLRDNFIATVSVPGGLNSSAPTDLNVSIGLPNQSPVGIVGGIYGAAVGGVPITEVIIPTGGSNSYNRYIATPSFAGSYRVSAQRSGMVSWLSTSQTVIAETPEFNFVPTTRLLYRGMTDTPFTDNGVRLYRTLTLAEPISVALSVSPTGSVSVPAPFSIPANSGFATLPLTGIEITTAPVLVNASASGYLPASPALSVEVRQANLLFRFLATSQIVGGARNGFQLRWLSGLASMDRPVVVAIVEQNPPGIVEGLYQSASGATPLPELTLRTGDTDASTATANPATIYVGAPRVAGSYRISVNVPGMGAWLSNTINVAADTPRLSLNRASPVVGLGLTCVESKITRSGMSLDEPLQIDLVSSNPALVSVPSSITLPAGVATMSVPISGLGLSASGVTITARPTGQSSPVAAITPTVVTPTMAFVDLRDTRGVQGQRDDFYVRWAVAGADEQQLALSAATVTVSVTEATPVGIVPRLFEADVGSVERTTLEIPAGHGTSATSAGVIDRLYAASPLVAGTYRLRATVSGLGTWDSLLQQVVTGQLRLSQQSHVVGAGLISTFLQVTRWVGSAQEPPGQPLSIALDCVSAAICSVPSTVVMSPGLSSVAIPVTGIAIGATRVTMSAVGHTLGTTYPEVDVRVVRPSLELVNLPQVLGVSASTSIRARFNVFTSQSPLQFAAADHQVDLSSTIPGVASLPASVVISSGSNVSADVVLQGIVSGRTTVNASSPSASPFATYEVRVSAEVP